jgi:hypothetical protein
MSGSLSVISNVFRSDAFSTVSLTRAVERNPFLPTGIGQLDIFEEVPIKTKAVAVQQYQGKLQIIPSSARGAPPTERVTEKRSARYFECPRFAHGDTVMASELQDVIDFDTNDQQILMQVQKEVARRLNGPVGILANMELTKERQRLGAVMGILRDFDDTTMFNWFQEFGITPPAEVVMNLAAAGAGTLRPLANGILRGIMRAAQGAFNVNARIIALCGDSFFDAFTNSVDVRSTFINQQEASELRAPNFFQSFMFAGIEWWNYRGTDDLTSVHVPTNKAFIFPAVKGIFQKALAPHDSFEWVNKLGLEQYIVNFTDKDRNAWERVEAYSYPLHICTRPETLYTATMDATAD